MFKSNQSTDKFSRLQKSKSRERRVSPTDPNEAPVFLSTQASTGMAPLKLGSNQKSIQNKQPPVQTSINIS
jgi:hypothetical protein